MSRHIVRWWEGLGDALLLKDKMLANLVRQMTMFFLLTSFMAGCGSPQRATSISESTSVAKTSSAPPISTAQQPSLVFDIETSGSLKSMVFGGEGLFLATMRGTGKVWLQSMPIRKLIRALAPLGRNRGKEGGVLGSLLNT